MESISRHFAAVCPDMYMKKRRQNVEMQLLEDLVTGNGLLIGRLVGWLVWSFVGRSVPDRWLVSLSFGRSDGWSVRCLTGWLVGWLVIRSVGHLVFLLVG